MATEPSTHVIQPSSLTFGVTTNMYGYTTMSFTCSWGQVMIYNHYPYSYFDMLLLVFIFNTPPRVPLLSLLLVNQ